MRHVRMLPATYHSGIQYLILGRRGVGLDGQTYMSIVTVRDPATNMGIQEGSSSPYENRPSWRVGRPDREALRSDG